MHCFWYYTWGVFLMHVAVLLSCAKVFIIISNVTTERLHSRCGYISYSEINDDSQNKYPKGQRVLCAKIFPGSVTFLKLTKLKDIGELCAATSDFVNQTCIHSRNTPIQIYWKFYNRKRKLLIKEFRYFPYFCSKHRLWVLVRTASVRQF